MKFLFLILIPMLFGPSFLFQSDEFRTEKLTFHKASDPNLSISILAEVAETDQQRIKGLMNRRFLPEDRGMLFVFEKDEIYSFWMKDTFIPLDIFFVDQTGNILSIAKNTTPLSEKQISPNQPYRKAIETNAGFADKHNIQVGDWVK